MIVWTYNWRQIKFQHQLWNKEGKQAVRMISSEELVKKARKVLFSIKSYTGSYKYLPVNVANSLFYSMVRPIAIYNSEITYMDTHISLYRAKGQICLEGI